jgi:hypothetical protein
VSRTSAAERSERKESLTRDKPQTIPARGQGEKRLAPLFAIKKVFLQLENECDILKNVQIQHC